MRLLPQTGLWTEPDFLRLWAAQAVSAMGSRFTRTALPIIAISLLAATPDQVALLAALSTAPGFVVGLLAGGLVDRNAKRPLLIGADLVRMVVVGSIPLALWLGMLGLWQLYAVAMLAGAATALFQIADNAYLPALIGKQRLVEANAKLEATDAGAEIAGPGLAGILIQTVGTAVTVVADSLTYLWSAVMLGRIRRPEPPIQAEPGELGVLHRLADDLRVGLRHGFRHPVIGPIFLATAAQTFFGGFFFALYMLYVLDVLGLSPAAVGMIIGVGGIGALIGSAIAGPMGRRLGVGPALAAALLLGQAGSLLIPAAAQAGDWQIPLLVLHQLIGDGFIVVFIIQAVAARQVLLPTAVLGRVNATLHVATGVMLPVATIIAGALATQLGVEMTVWIGVIGGLLAPLPLLAPSVLRLRTLEIPKESQA
ncbi:MAG: hypothetical protein RLY86_2934 [Pseudomonadota bacterium]|jgi:MFS family permease